MARPQRGLAILRWHSIFPKIDEKSPDFSKSVKNPQNEGFFMNRLTLEKKSDSQNRCSISRILECKPVDVNTGGLWGFKAKIRCLHRPAYTREF